MVGGAFGAFAEDLKFPLAFRDLGVNAFVVDAGIQTKIQMGIDDFAGDVADGIVTDTGVILSLRRREAAALGKTERCAVLEKEVFLQKKNDQRFQSTERDENKKGKNANAPLLQL